MPEGLDPDHLLTFLRQPSGSIASNLDFGVPYDYSPTQDQFVMLSPITTEQTQINVVLNWFKELKRRVPTN